jgi:DNA-binding transcriptional regulator YiaG
MQSAMIGCLVAGMVACSGVTVHFTEYRENSRFREYTLTFTEKREMAIKITVTSLIDAAKEKSGQTLGDFAKELDRNQTRISEWRTGKSKPDANEIAFFADKAGLPVIQTVAELEADLNPRYAYIWKKAVSELRQNQG